MKRGYFTPREICSGPNGRLDGCVSSNSTVIRALTSYSQEADDERLGHPKGHPKQSILDRGLVTAFRSNIQSVARQLAYKNGRLQ